MAEIRPYQQGDLEQLTALANAHIAVATPGFTRAGRVDRGAPRAQPRRARHRPLGRRAGHARGRRARARRRPRPSSTAYADEARVSDSLRGVGEIAWLFALPSAPARGRGPGRTSASRACAPGASAACSRSAAGSGRRPTACPTPGRTSRPCSRPPASATARVQEEVVLAAALDDLRAAPALDGVELVRVAFDEGAELRAAPRRRDARQAAAAAARPGRAAGPGPLGRGLGDRGRRGAPPPGRRPLARRPGRRVAPAGRPRPAAVRGAGRPTRRPPARSGGRSACSR